MILFFVYSRKTGELVSTIRSLPNQQDEVAQLVARDHKHDLTDLEVQTFPRSVGTVPARAKDSK